jgi:hypothetical protein
LRYNQDHLEFIGIYEERYEECLQAAMKHNDEDEVMNDEDVDEDGSQVKDEDMKEQATEEEVDDLAFLFPTWSSISTCLHPVLYLNIALYHHQPPVDALSQQSEDI